MSRADPLARVVFALLVAACFAAFFVTQRLKHTPTAVQRFKLTPYFSPYPSGHVREEAISFRVGDSEPVTVAVIDSNGNTVATLLHDHPLQRYKTLSLRWNGRRGEAHGYTTETSPSGRTTSLVPRTRGRLAQPGEYRIRVELRRKGKQVDSPKSFTLRAP
ncbi:MAG TPA: hypothetical protein VGD00_04825 [Solirubrobacteraceae bacterium]